MKMLYFTALLALAIAQTPAPGAPAPSVPQTAPPTTPVAQTPAQIFGALSTCGQACAISFASTGTVPCDPATATKFVDCLRTSSPACPASDGAVVNSLNAFCNAQISAATPATASTSPVAGNSTVGATNSNVAPTAPQSANLPTSSITGNAKSSASLPALPSSLVALCVGVAAFFISSY